jgi:hypothetical protein
LLLRKDSRSPGGRGGNLPYKLQGILVIGLVTLICGGEDFQDMEAFGQELRKGFPADGQRKPVGSVADIRKPPDDVWITGEESGHGRSEWREVQTAVDIDGMAGKKEDDWSQKDGSPLS